MKGGALFRRIPTAASAAVLCYVASIRWQGASLPPLRPLGPIIATARDSFGMLGGLLELPGGRVAIVDQGKQRVTILDSTLRQSKVIIDTSGAAPRRWGAG